MAAREAALAAKERGQVELEAALKLREGQVAVAEAAVAATQQRLDTLAKGLDSRSAADSDALRRLQETLAAQQEEVQR